jgi:hypothetical protein
MLLDFVPQTGFYCSKMDSRACIHSEEMPFSQMFEVAPLFTGAIGMNSRATC